jgi:hypothetical protein
MRLIAANGTLSHALRLLPLSLLLFINFALKRQKVSNGYDFKPEPLHFGLKRRVYGIM